MMNSNPTDKADNITKTDVAVPEKLSNRKQRQNFDRIKRKAKKALMKAGYKGKV